LLGWSTRCAVEIDPFCRYVLLARQRDGFLDRFPIWDDVCTFDGIPWKGEIDIITGGFPCQDISVAGKQKGIEGEKSNLVWEMLRIVREVRPHYVLMENSPNLLHHGFGDILGSLATMGYDAEWGVLGADDAGAPHHRKRIWILASYPERNYLRDFEQWVSGGRQKRIRDQRHDELVHHGQKEYVADTQSRGQSMCGRTPGQRRYALRDDLQTEGELQHAAESGLEGGGEGLSGRPDWWATEPDVGRVADGVAMRVD
jgi:DNA (cytosine-5)-methyltransferase 1